MPIDSSFNLTANDVFASLANMIISQEVFADNFNTHATLIGEARVDGSLFGDRKLYYACDALGSKEWGKDSEASNLLSLARPADPKVQAIVLDKFRQVALTIDNYLTKRAWSTEGAFASFNGVMMAMLADTKKIYEGTLYNVFIGTTATATGKQTQSLTLTEGSEAQSLAQQIADILVEMCDYEREYNDYGFLRSCSHDGIKIIWNSKWVNKIKKFDLPTIFHTEGLADKMDKYILPAKYFGRDVAAGDKGENKIIGTNGVIDNSKVANGGYIHTRIEREFTLGGVKKHYFPGDKLEDGVQVGGSGHPDFAETEVYVEDPKVICKIVTKLPPIMSAFETGTSFFNPRSLTETHYLTWGYNSLAYLKNYPFVTIKQA